MGIYSEFCEKRSVLFSTDVASRGLDFNKAVDWVVQVNHIKEMIVLNFRWCLISILFLFMKVDCPEDVASYIHRVGRTARYHSGGKSVLFIMPSEMKMLEQLESAKVPIQLIKVNVFFFFFFLSFSSPLPVLLVLFIISYEELCIQSIY